MAKINFKSLLSALFRGISQIVFAENAIIGLLLLISISLISPYAAIGALIGASFGTLLSRFIIVEFRPLWQYGFFGYNPAIVGLFWGGVLSSQPFSIASLVLLAIIATVALDGLIRRILLRINLEPLALSSLIITWSSVWIFHVFQVNFWQHQLFLPFGQIGLIIAITMIALLLAFTAHNAAFVTLLVAGSLWLVNTYLFNSTVMNVNFILNIGIILFALYGVFYKNLRIGLYMGFIAALSCTLIFILWHFSGLSYYMLPLMFPAILSIWLTTLLLSWQTSPWLRHHSLCKIASIIKQTTASKQPIVVMTGAGISTSSGIPDYVSGAWLEPGVSPTEYGYQQFIASPDSRQRYWTACRKFKRISADAQPNIAHSALTKLQERGLIGAIITQNVDGLHQGAKSKHVIEIHGNMRQTHCLSCNKQYDWPPETVADYSQLYCQTCGSLIKPSVVAMDEDIPVDVWQKAEAAIETAGALVIIGTQCAITSAYTLVERAKSRGIPLLIINQGPIVPILSKGDVFLSAPAQSALPALFALLKYESIIWRD